MSGGELGWASVYWEANVGTHAYLVDNTQAPSGWREACLEARQGPRERPLGLPPDTVPGPALEWHQKDWMSKRPRLTTVIRQASGKQAVADACLMPEAPFY